MVRNIIGTVANVGLGRISVARFAQIMESLDRHQASATAPACGLYLYRVEY
jgi:tRNA pseudouridine38-40 synthase